MNIIIFYFSGTGNTWWVSEQLKTIFINRRHEVTTYSMERNDLNWAELIPKLLVENNIIGIGYPVYGSNIPMNVKKWVMCGDTPLLMRRILKKCGFKIRQAINIRTLNNLPQMPRIMTWDKLKQGEIFEKARKKCEKLADYVLKNKKWVMRRDPITRLIAVF
ncbi:MAG: hypothetical protein ACFFDN_50470 [Candidatus Hodarchaeota archaeon]